MDGSKSPDIAIRDFVVDMSKREGAVNGFLSAVGVVGGVGVCASGVGTMACAAGALGALASGNHLYGDVQQALTGNEARTVLVQALTSSGLSLADARKYQAYVDAGVVVVTLGVVGGQAVYRFTVNGAKVSAADRTALAVLDQTSASGINGGVKLSQNKINEILSTAKGQRPDPSAYLSQAEIDAHLSKFSGGAVRFASADDVVKYGTAGPPNGGFVMPKSEFDSLIRQAGGDMRVVERKLGLDSGTLTSGKTVALEIKPQDMKNLRVPSGNEGGANSHWIPGGYTSGGVPEAVMDFANAPFTPIPFK